MSGIRIHIDEFIDDVRAGISDEALQAKHGVSGRRFLIAKAAARDYLERQKAAGLEPRLDIDAQQLLADVRAGVKNEELMTIYNLTERQLQKAYRHIISAGLATPMELSGRLSMTTSQVVEAFIAVGKRPEHQD
jgi:uncharacterized protein (DUF433 family)